MNRFESRSALTAKAAFHSGSQQHLRRDCDTGGPAGSSPVTHHGHGKPARIYDIHSGKLHRASLPPEMAVEPGGRGQKWHPGLSAALIVGSSLSLWALIIGGASWLVG
ncbi:MAG: hypothetical protein KF895_01270 [Parvibaculum sp.]|nr:hypothetical protein [Parvibaculum sp.]